MSERGSEKNISKEGVSKAITLSREISRIKVLDDKSPEANEKARNFLKGNFSTQYENVTRMVELSKDPGRTEDDPIKINAKKDLDLLGAAMLLAGQNKIEEWIIGAEVSSHLPSVFADIETVLANNLLVSGKNDQIGKEIVTQVGILEKANRRAALAPNSYEETRERETKKTIDVLLDKYDNVDSDSDDASKLGAVIGCLDDGLSKAAEKMAEAAKSGGRKEKTYVTHTPGAPDDDGNPGRGETGFSYGPEFGDFAKFVMRGIRTDLRESSPPSWYKELDEKEKYWYSMADNLSEAAQNKNALKDSVKLLEKLWFDDNIRLEVNESDLKMMYEKKGFRLALQKFVKDLCRLDKDSPEGSNFLYIRRDRRPGTESVKNPQGELEVSCKLLDLDTYKEEVAMYVCKTKIYSGNNNIDGLFEEEIRILMQSEKLDRDGAEKKWKKIHRFDETKIEVGTAWNFLYNCDFIESADFSRELGPTKGAKGDAINFIFHPEAKVSSKLKPEKLAVGNDEIKGGPLADWYDHQLQNDSKFMEEYKKGNNRIFPKRLGIGFLDTFKVKTDEGVVMSIAEALINEKNIDFSKNAATTKDIFKDYKDMREGSLVTFKYLTGQVPYDAKNARQWSVDAHNALSLLRQQGVMPDGKKLPVLEDVKLFAAIIYSSCGVNKTDKLLSLQCPGNSDYKEYVRQLSLQSFIKSTDSALNVVPRFGGFTKFQKEVFNFMYEGSIKRGVNSIFG